MKIENAKDIKDWAGRYTRNLERLRKIFDDAGVAEGVSTQMKVLQVYANALGRVSYSDDGSANISDADAAILKNDKAIKDTNGEEVKAALASVGANNGKATDAYTVITGFADTIAENLRGVERGAPTRRPG